MNHLVHVRDPSFTLVLGIVHLDKGELFNFFHDGPFCVASEFCHVPLHFPVSHIRVAIGPVFGVDHIANLYYAGGDFSHQTK